MKKIVAVLFFAISIFLSTDIQIVHAADIEQTSDNNFTTESFLYINPLYEDILDEKKILENSTLDNISTYGRSNYTTNKNKIIEDIRTAMRERENHFSVYYTRVGKLTKSDIEKWIELAFEETDNPKEGDYIRWHYQYINIKWNGTTEDEYNWNYKVDFEIDYYSTAEQEAELDVEVDKVFEEIGISDYNTDYTNLKLLYDYVCKNVSYDYDNLYDDEYILKYSAYAALVKKSAICQGYASLMYYMGEKAGIDMRLIAGTSFNQNHGWNIAKLNDQYYNLDATWDAEQKKYTYFLKGSHDFLNHKPFNEYMLSTFKSKYPISTTNYIPSAKTVIYNDFIFEVGDGYVTLRSYVGNAEDVVIPVSVEGKPVTKIRKNVFCNNAHIKRIVLPDTIKFVEKHIAYNCESLTDLYYLGTKDSFGLIDFEPNNDLFMLNIHYSDDENSFTTCNHTWNDPSIMENANCTFYGIKKKTCAICQEVIYERIKETDHSYSWVIDRCASEKTNGIKHEECKVCNSVKNSETIIHPSSSKLQYSKLSFTGERRIPSVLVNDAEGNPLIQGVDYYLTGDTSATNVGRYYIKVNYRGDYTGSKTLYYTIVPEKVTAFNAELSGGHNNVKISWTKSVGASGYYVSYKKSSEDSYCSQKKTTKNYYYFDDLSSNTEYDFRVVPYYLNSDTKYYLSSEYDYVTLKTLKNIKAPSSITGYLYVNHDDIRISWGKSSGAAGYNVYYKSALEDTYQLLDSTTARNTDKAKDLRDGIKYTFRVVPYYMDGNQKVDGYYGKIKSVYTLKKLDSPSISRYNSSKVRVKWNNISGESGYQIARSTTEDGTYSIISTYKTTSGKSKVVSAKKNKIYFYKVRSYKTVDGKKIYGPWSDITEYKLK